jgi:hypothetical protein
VKTVTWVAAIVLVAGLWIEYQKDSSFASVDAGSLVIGIGAGMFVGGML